MARVPVQTSPSVGASAQGTPGIQSQSYFQSRVPDAAFGQQQAVGLDRLGQGLANLGNDVQMVQNREAMLQAETDAMHAASDFSIKAGEASAKFQSLQGQNAVKGFADYQAQLDTLRKQTLESVKDPMTQQMLDKQLTSAYTGYMNSGQGHFQRQTLAANVNAANGMANQSINQAMSVIGDPVARDRALAEGAGYIAQAGEVQGLDDASIGAAQAAYYGKAYRSIIGNMAQSNPLAAQRLLSEKAGVMDAASQEALAQSLRAPVIGRQADNLVQGLTGQNPGILSRDADFDTVWDAQTRQESGQRQFGKDGQPLTSSAGAIGYAQVMPATARGVAKDLGIPFDENRYRTDAKYNEMLGKAYMKQMYQRYGDMNLALAAYNAGPQRVDEWLQKYGDPRSGRVGMQDWVQSIPIRETRDYVNRISARAGGNGVPSLPTALDGPALMQQVYELTQGDPELQRQAMSRMSSFISINNQALEQDRMVMRRNLQSVGTALDAGQSVSIPENDIRRIFPATQADALIEDLHVRKTAGQMFSSVQFASPEELSAMVQDVRDGSGPLSRTLRSSQDIFTGPDGAVAESDKARDFDVRQKVGMVLNERIRARNTAIAQDPAAYALQDPRVAQAAAAVDTSNPSTQAEYVDRLRAVQTRLGVPADQQRILTKGQSLELANKISSMDPAKGDMAQQLRAMQQQFGDSYPEVFRDLVRDGGLPKEWQILGNIATPVGQTDFQRMLVAIKEKGGQEQLRNIVGTQAKKDISDNLDDALAPFNSSVASGKQSGAQNLIAQMRDSVHNLASYYALGGMSGKVAVQQAADRLLNDRYDFGPTYRVPKGMMPQVNVAQNVIMRTLTADGLAPWAGNPELKQSERQQIALNAARNGIWVPRPDDQGLVLMAQLSNGGIVPVRKADGTQVGFSFNAMPTMADLPDNGLPRRGTTGGNRAGGYYETPGPDNPAAAPASPAPPQGAQLDMEPPLGGGVPQPRTNARGRWVPPAREQKKPFGQ